MKFNLSNAVKTKMYYSPGRDLRAFTLIELLTVVSIIAVMLAASVPAMNSISKSSGRKAAVSNVMNALEQARALAIRDGEATYVVFMTDASAPDTYRYKAYAVFEDTNTTSNATQVQVTKWYQLPSGVSFSNAVLNSSNTSVNNLLVQNPTFQASKTFTFTPGGKSPACPYVQFDTTGAVESPTAGGPFSIVLFEGFVSTSGLETMTSASKNGQALATEQVNIQKYTGRVQYVMQ